MQLSLKAKSMALFLLYLLALTAVYVTLGLSLLERENRVAHERLNHTAAILAAEVDLQLEAGRRRLETVGSLPGLTFGLERLIDNAAGRSIPAWTTLHYLFFDPPVFTGGVFLLDRSGTVLWNEPPALAWQGIMLGDDETVREALERESTVISGALGADELLATPHVLVVYPIQRKQGDVVGFVGGAIDLDDAPWLDIVAVASRTSERFVVLTDAEGKVVASTSGLAELAPWKPDDVDDEVLLANRQLMLGGWKVWVGEQKSSALASSRQLERLLFWFGIVLVAVTALVGAAFLRSFTGGVAVLTRHAEVMASGDLSQPVVLARRDELGVLAATFERMRSELQRSQHALEERLTERDELLRLKEEFLANTSHELRTPLNVIFGYTEMLEEDETDPERRAVLEGVRCQAGRLLDLFNDLMTISGVNSGRVQLRSGRVDVPAMLARLAPLTPPAVRGKELRVVWDVSDDLPPLHTDEVRLEQVLANLLVNAIKFTSAGKVVVSVRGEPEGRMTFTISDTGIGIPANELPFIFDEFRQVDGSMSREHGGMGLGLAVVKKLVTLLGGEIRVKSLMGRGSVFSVELPLGEARDDEAEHGESAVVRA